MSLSYLSSSTSLSILSSLSLSLSLLLSLCWKNVRRRRHKNLSSSIIINGENIQSQLQQQQNYIEYNLADYCTEETWSDYPGRHHIRLEKSLKIRLPSILDFQFNETHRQRMGFFNPGVYPIDDHIDSSIHHHQHKQQQPSFVPYCLLSFTVDYGHRIYAEGLATGLITGGKEWFTETLHFSNSKRTFQISNSQQQQQQPLPPEIGTFTISTTKNALTLVFEQLHNGPFSFHLILTPFRDAKPEFMFRCENEHEYQCTNGRCIAKYLTCDHHNNCGDYSDEHVNCMPQILTTQSSSPSSESSGDGRDSGQTDYWPPPSPSSSPPPPSMQYPYQPTSQLPTFPIDSNFDDDDRTSGTFDGDSIPEYFDVPFPGRDRHKTTHGPTTFHKPKPMNGFHSTEVHTGGGFLGDLFRFDSEHTSNVVKVVRYLLALLLIIILVTLINFLIWCLITKRDQSFIETTPPPVEQTVQSSSSEIPHSSSSQSQRQLPLISIISV